MTENISYVELHITCNNSAFYNEAEDKQEPESEVVRILRELADNIETLGIEEATHLWLKDINGNNVGKFDCSEGYFMPEF